MGSGMACIGSAAMVPWVHAANVSAGIRQGAARPVTRTRSAIVDVRRIWDRAPSHQYPDITRFGDSWFVVCREADMFGSGGSGTVRVIRSGDEGVTWEPVALFTSPRVSDAADQKKKMIDLRDPKIAVNGDRELMVTAFDCNTRENPEKYPFQTLAWFSPDGANWSCPHEIGDAGTIIWRITWHQGKGYSLAYHGGIYVSTDGSGREFRKVGDCGVAGSESAVVFWQDDELDWIAHAIFRYSSNAHVGIAYPPYTDWEWKALGVPIGGPDMIALPDGRMVTVVRLYDGHLPPPIGCPEYGRTTSLCWVDPYHGTMHEFLTLPAGGRGHAYGGLAWHDGFLWVVYFSAHEVWQGKKQSIYLAKVVL